MANDFIIPELLADAVEKRLKIFSHPIASFQGEQDVREEPINFSSSKSPLAGITKETKPIPQVLKLYNFATNSGLEV